MGLRPALEAMRNTVVVVGVDALRFQSHPKVGDRCMEQVGEELVVVLQPET